MVEEVATVRTRPRRRWVLPALGLAVALLFGYVATHRYPLESAGRPALPEQAGAGLPRVTGDRGAGPDGLRLLVSGSHPSVLDAHAGRTAPVPGLRLGRDEGARLQPVPGGLVATVAGPAAVRSRTLLLPAGGGPAVRLGEDVRVVPARHGGDLLVSAYGVGGTVVRRTDRTGRVRVSWTLRGRAVPLADTAAGLVVARFGTTGSSGADLLLVEPRSGQVRRRLAADRIPLAVGTSAVAHLSADCGRACTLTVTDLAGGRSREFRGPEEGRPRRGEFSPDGRWLALAVPGQYLNGRLAVRPGFAAVLDLATGGLQRVPGVQTAAERTPDLGWWRPGWLVLGIWSDDRAQLAVWSPAPPGTALRVLPAQPAGDHRYASVTVLP